MSDLKPNAQEDKDVESLSDSPGRTLEPLQTHTFSLKNNAAGLSSDEHENPLNGTQPNPFVYSSVPAVPHAGNSLPSGAPVNGPGSHPNSEVHCVLNKGTVLSNNVLDAAWQAGKDMSPEVLPPPSELQSDAWKNTAGPVVKTLATQPGVNTPLSHPAENESKQACYTLSGDSAEQMHISQHLTEQTMKTRSRWDAEWSESSSDDYDDAEGIRWDSARERFLPDDRRLETEVMKHNTHAKSMSGSLGKVNSSLNHMHRRSCLCTGNDVENVDIGNMDDSLGTQSDMKYSAVAFKDLSRNTASDSEHYIYSTVQEGCNEENYPEDGDNFSPKVEQLKAEQVEQDPLFFSCTTCNVNFKEKVHFHRHMMYHLGRHNQVKTENVSQPFICRECGRLFCDSNSLMSHIIIHQDRMKKLMEKIQGLKNSEDRQCPRCGFGCNCPKIFVQHVKTHNNLKHYYFCEKCNYITLTQQALEVHLHVTHLNAYQPQNRKVTHANNAQCKMDFFIRRNKALLESQSQLEHQQSHCGTVREKDADQHQSELDLSTKFAERDNFSRGSDKIETPEFKCQVGCTRNMLSPSLWRVDVDGKLLLQPVGKFDASTDLTCVEEDAENCDCEAFGSSEQASSSTAAEVLPSARNLKLDQMLYQRSDNGRASERLLTQTKQNSPSMRKMSTPLHGAIDSLNGNIAARLSQRLEKQSADRELENNFSDDTSGAPGSFLESWENERNPYARRYFRKRLSAKDQSLRVLKREDDGDEDCSDIEQLVIKEEYIETTVCDDSPESPCTSTSESFDVFPTPGANNKPCPYCPASFESGVGLSNHVRGHLHRAGLSYDARHMVPPEQVALWDCRPRIRRRIPRGMRNMRKAVKPETQPEHTCPLCWDWFDTKTGLSNHVRGHLKRIGKSVTSTSKSPLYILTKLLQDKKEHGNTLQDLSKRPFSQTFVPHRSFRRSMGVNDQVQFDVQSSHSISDSLVQNQEDEGFVSERKTLPAEAQTGTRVSSGTLVGLLRLRQDGLEASARDTQEDCESTKFCGLTNEENQRTGVEPNQSNGECDSNEICIECNSTFPSLPHHLRAYAHRKRIGIFEGAGYDYKQKKPRLRPGLRKKILPSLNAEIYTLTCRFCDLVFRGTMSIQEDWIKHLQRHLRHTGVPRSGTGLVEVWGLHHKIQINMSGERPDVE